MSDTTTTPPDPPKPVQQQTRSVPDTMLSQRFIYAMACLPIVCGILWASFMYLDKATAATICGVALAGLLTNQSNFLYGSAKQDTPQTPPAKP